MLVSCVKPCRPIFEIEFVPTFAAQSLSHFSFLPILIENISLRRQGHRLTQNICRCYQNYSRPLLRYCLTLVCFTGNLQFVSRLRGMFNFAKLPAGLFEQEIWLSFAFKSHDHAFSIAILSGHYLFERHFTVAMVLKS